MKPWSTEFLPRTAVDMPTSLTFYKTKRQTHFTSRSYHCPSLARNSEALGRFFRREAEVNCRSLGNSLLISSQVCVCVASKKALSIRYKVSQAPGTSLQSCFKRAVVAHDRHSPHPLHPQACASAGISSHSPMSSAIPWKSHSLVNLCFLCHSSELFLVQLQLPWLHQLINRVRNFGEVSK